MYMKARQERHWPPFGAESPRMETTRRSLTTRAISCSPLNGRVRCEFQGDGAPLNDSTVSMLGHRRAPMSSSSNLRVDPGMPDVEHTLAWVESDHLSLWMHCQREANIGGSCGDIKQLAIVWHRFNQPFLQPRSIPKLISRLVCQGFMI